MGLCQFKETNEDIQFDLRRQCMLDYIKEKYDEKHATEENAISLIICDALLKHIHYESQHCQHSTDQYTLVVIEKVYDVLCMAMMPLGPTDFGIFQAFDGIVHDPVFQSCGGLQWMKNQQMPMPPLLIFHQFFDAKAREYRNSSCTISQGQLRASVLADPHTSELYERETGKQRDRRSSIDTAFVQFVTDRWDEIGSKWYDDKLQHTRHCLKNWSFAAGEQRSHHSY